MHKEQAQAIVDQGVKLLFETGAASYKVEINDFVQQGSNAYRGTSLFSVEISRQVPEKTQAQTVEAPPWGQER